MPLDLTRRKVARALNEANARGEFDRLIPHALGELNHALDAPAQRKIVVQLQKDLTMYRTPISRSTFPI